MVDSGLVKTSDVGEMCTEALCGRWGLVMGFVVDEVVKGLEML